MTKIASFDLEIAKEIPEGVDWKTIAPLGISCAALHVDECDPTPEFFWSVPQLDQEHAENLVFRLQVLENQGYKIVTWNGCGFDFAVLAQESGMVKECADLAMNHVDLMLCVTFQKGYYLGLNKAAVGMGLAGKTHEVTLSTGQTITEMGGALAPQMWQSGETEAVLTYLAGDVLQTNELAHAIENHQSIRWTSNSGKFQFCPIQKLYTVKELFDLPKPDTSWMSKPVTRESFIEWMPK
jgi:hypothetical protein